MALGFLSSLFKKKKDTSESETEELVAELEEKLEGSKEEEEMIEQIAERINEIENEIPRIKISIDTMKKQFQETREDIERLEKTIKDVMMLYEVISQEINPFKEQMASENPLSQELQELRQQLEEIRSELAQIKSDLKVVAGYGVIDIDSIIYEALSEV
ncbi:flagellar protein FlaC [Thermococcus sp. P6]|uniref:flagella accessory protein C n=1 Tax=Thermococcus sp. P6 TaxID=122420 RepID=UPI000B59AF64|nr:flagella accessory protein C [Thermococcus sp. P6]ASJ11163.1 flagellar protein FlaC [Thermococcus sp. P6]